MSSGLTEEPAPLASLRGCSWVTHGSTPSHRGIDPAHKSLFLHWPPGPKLTLVVRTNQVVERTRSSIGSTTAASSLRAFARSIQRRGQDMICRDARTGGSLFGFRVSGGGYWVVWNGTALLACLHASCRVVSCRVLPAPPRIYMVVMFPSQRAQKLARMYYTRRLALHSVLYWCINFYTSCVRVTK